MPGFCVLLLNAKLVYVKASLIHDVRVDERANPGLVGCKMSVCLCVPFLNCACWLLGVASDKIPG